MGEVSRRDLLKKSVVAGGLVWTAPMLSSGVAWGQASEGCGCGEGTLVYAKYAPGNSQTCQNQCLQPGDIARVDFSCLVEEGIVTVADTVESNDDKASLTFNQGTYLARLAIKSENDCFVVRCEEGFGQLYKWESSTNAEIYNSETAIDDPATEGDATPLFVVYNNGTECGNSAGDSCASKVTGVTLDTEDIPGVNKLNFIEMELCVLNLSVLQCDFIDCTHFETTPT